LSQSALERRDFPTFSVPSFLQLRPVGVGVPLFVSSRRRREFLFSPSPVGFFLCLFQSVSVSTSFFSVSVGVRGVGLCSPPLLRCEASFSSLCLLLPPSNDSGLFLQCLGVAPIPA